MTKPRRPLSVCEKSDAKIEHAHLNPGPDGVCCRDCAALWFGSTAAHCARCHRTFGGESAFAVHALKDECRPPSECRPKLEEVGGYWVIPQKDSGAPASE